MPVAILRTAGLAAGASPELQRLRQSTDAFEGVLFQEMLKSMRRSGPDLSGNGMGSAMFRDMFDVELGKSAARTTQSGPGDLMFRSLGSALLEQEGNRLTGKSADMKRGEQ